MVMRVPKVNHDTLDTNQYMCNSKFQAPIISIIQHHTPAAGSLQLLLSHNRNQIELERDCEKAVRRLSIPRNTAYYRAAQTRESNTFNSVFGYVYTMSVKQCVFLDQTHIHQAVRKQDPGTRESELLREAQDKPSKPPQPQEGCLEPK